MGDGTKKRRFKRPLYLQVGGTEYGDKIRSGQLPLYHKANLSQVGVAHLYSDPLTHHHALRGALGSIRRGRFSLTREGHRVSQCIFTCL